MEDDGSLLDYDCCPAVFFGWLKPTCPASLRLRYFITFNSLTSGRNLCRLDFSGWQDTTIFLHDRPDEVSFSSAFHLESPLSHQSKRAYLQLEVVSKRIYEQGTSFLIEFQ